MKIETGVIRFYLEYVVQTAQVDKNVIDNVNVLLVVLLL